jgi:hypothetical protein
VNVLHGQKKNIQLNVGQAIILVHIDFTGFCLIASNVTKEKVGLK